MVAQAGGADFVSRGLLQALLGLYAALAAAPESLAASLGRTPAPDAPPVLQVAWPQGIDGS